MTATAVVEATGLSVDRGRRRVLHEITLALRPGEALAVVGPNASGKSTLLRALAGLLPAAAGEVQVDGRRAGTVGRQRWARTVALVTTDESAAGDLTVEERVRLGRYPHLGPFRPAGDADRRAVADALRRAGIESLAARPLGTLSAGERQLATLARGLAQEPRALLLDEPAAHLDVGHQLALFRVLDEVRAQGVGVLAVVHDLQRASAWAERAVLLAGGRIGAEGRPDDVLGSPACAEAFGVAIAAHAVTGVSHPLYEFRPLR